MTLEALKNRFETDQTSLVAELTEKLIRISNGKWQAGSIVYVVEGNNDLGSPGVLIPYKPWLGETRKEWICIEWERPHPPMSAFWDHSLEDAIKMVIETAVSAEENGETIELIDSDDTPLLLLATSPPDE